MRACRLSASFVVSERTAAGERKLLGLAPETIRLLSRWMRQESLTPYRLVGMVRLHGLDRIHMAPPASHDSKTLLLNAALQLIRSKGYAGTTVEDICNEAGVTKGSFFHHFKSKDDLALGATAHWEAMTEGFFASAPYHTHSDPLERLLGYVDFRGAILMGELPDYTCLLGTLVQETYATHPQIRAACDR